MSNKINERGLKLKYLISYFVVKNYIVMSDLHVLYKCSLYRSEQAAKPTLNLSSPVGRYYKRTG